MPEKTAEIKPTSTQIGLNGSESSFNPIIKTPINAIEKKSH